MNRENKRKKMRNIIIRTMPVQIPSLAKYAGAR